MSGNLLIKTGPSGRSDRPITVLVGKNVFGSAAKRNLLKRRIRSILIPHVRGANLKFVVIAKPSSANASFNEIREEILSQIARTKK